jgi:hypothetical protein
MCGAPQSGFALRRHQAGIEDFHLQAVVHARHTNKAAAPPDGQRVGTAKRRRKKAKNLKHKASVPKRTKAKKTRAKPSKSKAGKGSANKTPRAQLERPGGAGAEAAAADLAIGVLCTSTPLLAPDPIEGRRLCFAAYGMWGCWVRFDNRGVVHVDPVAGTAPAPAASWIVCSERPSSIVRPQPDFVKRKSTTSASRRSSRFRAFRPRCAPDRTALCRGCGG